MTKNCIIYETFNAANTLDQKRGSDGLMRLEGVFGVCGVRNNNGRVYEHSNYSQMISEMQERINTIGCPGELEHPNSMNINMENISHKVESISIDEQGVVTGTIVLLNTPKGEIAQRIVEGGLPLFISSRARGQVSKNGSVQLQELKTYDLVGTPGFSQAQMNLSSNQTFESLNENCVIVYEEGEEEAPVANNIKENKINKIMESKFKNKIDALEQRIEEQAEDLKQLQICNNNLLELINNKPTINESKIKEIIIETFTDNIADNIQEWVCEEVVDTISEGTQNWFMEEVSPILAESTQKWVIEEFAPEIQGWIVNEVAPTFDEWVQNEISESMEGYEAPTNSLDRIDKVLDMLESNQPTKKIIDMGVINESKFTNQPFLNTIPDHLVAKWEASSDLVKENIATRAKLYNFNDQSIVEGFWSKCSFNEPMIKEEFGSKIITFETSNKDETLRNSLRATGKKLGLL